MTDFNSESLIKPGEYKAKIINCRWTAKNDYGNPKLSIQFAVLDENTEFNKRCTKYFDLNPPAEKQKYAAFAAKELERLLDSIGASPLETSKDNYDRPVVDRKSLKEVLFKEATINVDVLAANGKVFNTVNMQNPFSGSPSNYSAVKTPGRTEPDGPIPIKALTKLEASWDDEIPF